MKKHWERTKYFWIGGIMGIAQQLLGRLDFYLYRGHDLFRFSALMGGLSIYAALILFVIQRGQPAKQHFRDLFLYFLGLDLFYYLYVFADELVFYLFLKDRSHETAYYFQKSYGEIFDFLKWTVIGTLAGLWAFLAAKARQNGKRVRYGLMLFPLFAVIVSELGGAAVGMYHYAVQEYHTAHNIQNPVGMSYTCPIAELLTSLAALLVSVYFYWFRRKHTAETK